MLQKGCLLLGTNQTAEPRIRLVFRKQFAGSAKTSTPNYPTGLVFCQRVVVGVRVRGQAIEKLNLLSVALQMFCHCRA